MNDELLQLAEEELQQIRKYREVFIETHGYPPSPDYEVFDKDKYNFRDVVGVSSVGFAVAAIGGIIFAALRTMMVFVQTEVSQLNTYGWSSTVTVLVGILAAGSIMAVIELFLASWGYEKGKESGSLDLNWTGPLIAAAISALAGFIPSLSMLPDGSAKTYVASFLGWLLFGLSGLGVTALVFFGAHNLGVIHTKWVEYLKEKEDEVNRKNKEKEKEYDIAVKEWNAALEQDYRRKGREILFGKGTYTVTAASREKKQAPKNPNSNGATQTLRDFLKSSGIRPSEIGRGDEHRYRPLDIGNAAGLQPKDIENISTYLARLKAEEHEGRWDN